MKSIGLIKQFDSDADDAKPLKQFLGEVEMDEQLTRNITSYLRRGILVAGIMEWWFDFENYGENFSQNKNFKDDEDETTSIGGKGYYTDGNWVWAGYLPYYLEKYPNFNIDEEFLADLKQQNYQIPQVSKAQENEARIFFDNHICK
jgi:phosphoglycolate phosphatase-like HAD superfamily hydrolase